MRVVLTLPVVMMLLLVFPVSVPAVAEEGTVWEASTTMPLGRAGVTLQLHAADQATCDLRARGAGGGEDRLTVGFIESPDFYGWGAAGGRNVLRLHAGPVDTDAVIDDGTGYSQIGFGFQNYTFTGDILVGFAGTDLQPWPDEVRDGWPFPGEAPGGHSISFSVRCTGGVTLSMTGGTGAILFNQGHAEGGIGADALLVASANVADHVESTYSASAVLVATGSFGQQAGTATFDTPQGQEQVALTTETAPYLRWNGPAGAYGITLDRVAFGSEAFWAVVFGLHPVEALEEIPALAP